MGDHFGEYDGFIKGDTRSLGCVSLISVSFQPASPPTDPS